MNTKIRKKIGQERQGFYEIRKRHKNPNISEENKQALIDENVINEAFSINSQFAYFVGVYFSDTDVVIEVIDFNFNSVLSEVKDSIKTRLKYEDSSEAWDFIHDTITEISKIFKIEAVAIVFNKLMSYKDNLAFVEDKDRLKLFFAPSLSPTQFWKTNYEIFWADDVLAYTLYLREKVVSNNEMLFYDVAQNRISYLKNGILKKSSNPRFGVLYSKKAIADVYKDNELLDMLYDSIYYIKALINPEVLVLSSDCISQQLHSLLYHNYNDLYTNLKLIKTTQNQKAKGAAIYAAYSFFDWELKW